MYAPMGSYTVYAYRYTSDWGIYEGEDEDGNYYLEYQNGSISDYTGNNKFDSYDSSIVSSATVTSSAVQTVSFDISSFVECWINDHSTFSQGIMLKLADDDSSEHEGAEYVNVYNTESSSYDAYISLDYGNIVGENYINNKQTGHFLEYYGGGTNATTSTYNIYTRLKWKITYYGNNQYIIKSSVSDTLYLCSRNGLTAKTVSYSGTITNEYLWTITYNASYDGYLIKNVVYNKYLKATDSDTTTLSSTLDSYCVWRLKVPSKYRNLTEFTIGDVVGRLDSNASYAVDKDNTATWSANSDFMFSTTYQLSVNYTSSTILCNKNGTHSVTVTHKPSGKISTFDLVVYRPAVFLIHGRGDNSITLWGATTKVWVDPNDTSKKANNHFNTSLTKTNNTITNAYEYTSVDTQRIASFNYGEVTIPAIFNGEYTSDGYVSTHTDGGNLAFYLQNQGYVINEDIYVFNYPNEDAVIHSANKLDAYLTNLGNEIRSNGTKQQKASLFGKIDGITAATPLNIHIVGHSMGGLVARYYIENIGKDENVEKLITIDTPHWGSALATISDDVPIASIWLHRLCDHDLDPLSVMFYKSNGSSESPLIFCTDCGGILYNISPTLNYTANRRTDYYAIVGFNFTCQEIKDEFENDEYIPVSLPGDYENISELKEVLDEVYVCVEPLSMLNDNVVDFLSQIGCYLNVLTSECTIVRFKEIYLHIDISEESSLSPDNHLHGKIPHKDDVMSKVVNFLDG